MLRCAEISMCDALNNGQRCDRDQGIVSGAKANDDDSRH
jgi:hypothetical protein